jgi:hypothetical protein
MQLALSNCCAVLMMYRTNALYTIATLYHPIIARKEIGGVKILCNGSTRGFEHANKPGYVNLFDEYNGRHP